VGKNTRGRESEKGRSTVMKGGKGKQSRWEVFFWYKCPEKKKEKFAHSATRKTRENGNCAGEERNNNNGKTSTKVHDLKTTSSWFQGVRKITF